jgi:carboxyl-terminal processing protease
MKSRAVVVVLVMGTVLATGGWLLQRGFRGGEARPVDTAHLFNEVLGRISRQYVDSLPADELYERAVEGMLEELHDPHTAYLPPDRLKRFEESTTGNYAGIGVQMDIRDGWITVVAPLPGTPAERSGVETGDRIVRIDGRSTKGWTSEEASRALRGPSGSKVPIEIVRQGMEEPRAIVLTRAEIHRSAVQRPLLLDGGVGYVDVNIFSDSTGLELRRAIDSLRTAGAVSLIVDLRNNPGGLLTQGVEVSDLFLDPGQRIVSMRGRVIDANRDFADEHAQPWPEMPVVVLVDDGSASASEIVAGALQDHDRAAIVGQPSFGKGSAQSLFALANGGAVKLTTARWFTPLGRSISRPMVDEDEVDGAPAGDDAGERAASGGATFTTPSGRTLHGGGGIAPDVIAGDTVLAPADRALVEALGSDFGRFRDAVTDQALSLRLSRAFTSPDDDVTPAMRDALWDRMRQRGVTIERAVYDAGAPLVARLLGNEIVRYGFGRQAEARREVGRDPVVGVARGLLAGVASPQALLTRLPPREDLATGER